MNDTIINNLKQLQSIRPDAGFARSSRMIVLAARPKIVESQLAWRFFPALTFVALLIIGLAYVPGRANNAQASLDSKIINQEFNDLEINIELKEISYDQAASEAVASALLKITGENN